MKIGTRSLLLDDRSFDFKSIASLVHDIKHMVRNAGMEIVLVTSGAVSAGMRKLGITERPRDLVLQQVAASVGNPLLLNEYVRMFDDMPVAQVLLTQHDLSNRKTYNHFSDTMERLLSMHIVPIVNENDVISIDELADTRSGESGKDYNFSDNDVLSALVAASIEADLLVILSDVDGLYTKNPTAPDAEFIPFVDQLTEDVVRMGQGGSRYGRGGMATKLRAAEICVQSGVWMIIANAKQTDLHQLLDGKLKCTVFKPAERMPGKKLWMVFAANVSGRLILDKGAVNAIAKGASILLPGIVNVQGDFNKGDVIELVTAEGDNIIGKGVVNYSSQEIERFINLHKQNPQMFKLQGVDVIILRERMALTKGPS